MEPACGCEANFKRQAQLLYLVAGIIDVELPGDLGARQPDLLLADLTSPCTSKNMVTIGCAKRSKNRLKIRYYESRCLIKFLLLTIHYFLLSNDWSSNV